MFVLYTIIQVNTLAEEKFEQFIAVKLLERVKNIVMQKKLEVKATSELAKIFREAIIKSRK